MIERAVAALIDHVKRLDQVQNRLYSSWAFQFDLDLKSSPFEI